MPDVWVTQDEIAAHPSELYLYENYERNKRVTIH